MTLHFLGLDSGSVGAEVTVLWMAVKEVSMGRVEKGVVSVLETFFELLSMRFQTNSMLVGSRSAFCSLMGVMRCRLAVEWDLTLALLVATVMS